MTVTLRAAVPTDAGEISRLYAQSWRAAYPGLVPQSYLDELQDHHWTQTVADWITTGRFTALLAFEKEVMAGCAIYGRAKRGEVRRLGRAGIPLCHARSLSQGLRQPSGPANGTGNESAGLVRLLPVGARRQPGAPALFMRRPGLRIPARLSPLRWRTRRCWTAGTGWNSNRVEQKRRTGSFFSRAALCILCLHTVKPCVHFRRTLYERRCMRDSSAILAAVAPSDTAVTICRKALRRMSPAANTPAMGVTVSSPART